jgi:hypothetical protein
MQIPTTQSVATLRLAQEYDRASTQIGGAVPNTSFVRYQLYGQAIELALKAFLISQGTTDNKLRKIGHDLTTALKKAQSYDGFGSVGLSEADIGVITWLTANYKAKEFSYIRVGYYSLPPLSAVSHVSNTLVGRMQRVIRRAVMAQLRQPST